MAKKATTTAHTFSKMGIEEVQKRMERKGSESWRPLTIQTTKLKTDH